jgi:hypothetical protein
MAIKDASRVNFKAKKNPITTTNQNQHVNDVVSTDTVKPTQAEQRRKIRPHK